MLLSKKYLLLALFVGLSFFLAGLAVFRSSYFQPPETGAGGFGISPPTIAANLRPGDVMERRINVLRSEADNKETVRIKIDTSKLSGWVTVMPAAGIELMPGDFKAPFMVAVRVPPDAAAGVYDGAVRLTLKGEEKISGVGIELGARLDLRLKIEGAGKTLPAADASASEPLMIPAGAFSDRLQGKFVMRVEAAGEIYYLDPSSRTLYHLARPEDAYRLVQMLGAGINAKDLAAIPCAVIFPSAPDSDRDGLPDEMETALGTDRRSADTDQDGLDDKFEITNGYDPLQRGQAQIYNRNLIERLKGRILLAVGGRGEGWYVKPGEDRRYFLGQPDYAWQVLKQVAVGVSEKDFSSLIGD